MEFCRVITGMEEGWTYTVDPPTTFTFLTFVNKNAQQIKHSETSGICVLLFGIYPVIQCCSARGPRVVPTSSMTSVDSNRQMKCSSFDVFLNISSIVITGRKTVFAILR
jgi:hypothetical protein